jgi:putative transposase
MPQSLAKVLVHLVFSTKDRRALLDDADLRDQMHRYLAGISSKLGCPTVIVGGTGDHVHVLGRPSRTVTLADWVKELKRASCVWARTKDRRWSRFQWQAGYGAFSVSQSQSGRVRQYIASQEEHHRRSSFQEELRLLLQKHGVEFDEQYVWD